MAGPRRIHTGFPNTLSCRLVILLLTKLVNGEVSCHCEECSPNRRAIMTKQPQFKKFGKVILKPGLLRRNQSAIRGSLLAMTAYYFFRAASKIFDRYSARLAMVGPGIR